MKFPRIVFWSCIIICMTVIGENLEKHLLTTSQIIYNVPTMQKVVALTIDDGPHYKTTLEILDILREKQVKATFFVLGENVEHLPKILAQEVKDGHEIGMHTYSHPSLSKLSEVKIIEEFDKAEKALSSIVPKPNLFRPPGGAYNNDVFKVARQKGYTVVLWSIDPRDWSRPPVNQVIDQVVRDVKPGSIILLHDGQYPLPTPQALSIIIDRLREQGYEFVTVSELLQYYEARPSISMFNSLFR